MLHNFRVEKKKLSKIRAFLGFVIKPFIRFVWHISPNVFEGMADMAIYVLRGETKSGKCNFLNYGIHNIPSKIEGFHDLYWLFSCSQANRGIIGLDFDEAAYLYKLCLGLPEGACVVEIGRFLGGSTFLLASVLPKGGSLISIDNKRRTSKHVDVSNDDTIYRALNKASLKDKVELIIADSSSYTPPTNKQFDLIFIDGDHSYEGVKKDYQHWSLMLKKGAYIVFHDSGASRCHATKFSGPEKLAQKIRNDTNSGLTYLTTIGSLVSFKKENDLS